ncbi:hypothetical protein GQ43DRAFT_111809 [Delitschia confertaspora ATCC 74209]|uniref:Pyridoxamine 5'-phosphate oxidase family protein n=1 Tax=Delitschia confertaspora ATCC 74209 TaxID=1513339 RepID=A0A9P4MNJ4_9PLEO|nr:hypothetical protein GQ43DRAFT_111809 [Delitschia confertaspora ATCC 74209]
MGAFYETIPNSLKSWILNQKMLWVATAPLSAQGHINISPKGGQHFGILDERTFWFMDLSGSGIETTAHLNEPGNGRICVMFQAMEGPPRIVRIWGVGTALESGTPEYSSFVKEHNVKTLYHSRSIIVVDIHQVGSSCGFSVPFYEFKGWRNTLDEVFEKKKKKYEEGKEEESMERYWAWKSQASIDGLPGMRRGMEVAKREGVAPLKKMVGAWAVENRQRLRREGRRVDGVYLLVVGLLGVVIGMVVVAMGVEPETVGLVQERLRVFQWLG